MKIIDIGICIDNVDPKGIGRIRVVRYNDYVGEKEKAKNYEAFSNEDPFVALPFLPVNINFIPEIDQLVKILNYNTEKLTVNAEYIAGPFTTMFDFNNQQFSNQIENTTYGVAIKPKNDIIKSTGEYINKKSNDVFAKDTDFAIYGKYGSDVLFTHNGLQLRGGKLEDKKILTPFTKQKAISFPLMSEKSSNLFLKKFPTKAKLVKTTRDETVYDSANLNYVVEYELTSLSGTTDIKFFVYKIVNAYGNVFNSNIFNEFTNFSINENIKLINTDNTTTTPTHIVTNVDIENVDIEVRDVIFLLHEKSLHKLNKLYSKENLHPFYYRPSLTFKNMATNNSTEENNKKNILQNIKLKQDGTSAGLVWSISSISPTFNVIRKTESSLEFENGYQTFSALKSDKIFLISTDTNEGNPPCVNCGNSIDFTKLNNYEWTQEDYIDKIEPNTYATVRGENLLRFLRQLVFVVFTHRHNINKSIESQPDYAEGNILREMLKTIETDLLNKSIRVN